MSSRAKNGIRTRDLHLGKVALYQLSYFRNFNTRVSGYLVNRFNELYLLLILKATSIRRRRDGALPPDSYRDELFSHSSIPAKAGNQRFSGANLVNIISEHLVFTTLKRMQI